MLYQSTKSLGKITIILHIMYDLTDQKFIRYVEHESSAPFLTNPIAGAHINMFELEQWNMARQPIQLTTVTINEKH